MERLDKSSACQRQPPPSAGHKTQQTKSDSQHALSAAADSLWLSSRRHLGRAAEAVILPVSVCCQLQASARTGKGRGAGCVVGSDVQVKDRLGKH